MNVNVRAGDEATQRGGADLVISLSRDEAVALGPEAGNLAAWFSSALDALVALRTGHVGGDPERAAADVENVYYWAVNDIYTRLSPRLSGILGAAIRAHIAAGGSLDRLALAMDVSKSTAQRPWNKARGDEPTVWERWADGSLDEALRAELPDVPDELAGDEVDEWDPVLATIPPMPVHVVTYRDRATGRRVEAMRTENFDAAAAELARLRRQGAPMATMYIEGR